MNDLWEDAYTCPIYAMNCTTNSAHLVTGRFAFELRWWVVLRIFAGYVVLHANIVYRNIKNRTVCFQERFRLLSLAAVLRKQTSWFQNPIDIVFWNRNGCFLRTGRSQNPENKSVLFFIKPRLCSMQHSGCENLSIHVANGRPQR